MISPVKVHCYVRSSTLTSSSCWLCWVLHHSLFQPWWRFKSGNVIPVVLQKLLMWLQRRAVLLLTLKQKLMPQTAVRWDFLIMFTHRVIVRQGPIHYMSVEILLIVGHRLYGCSLLLCLYEALWNINGKITYYLWMKIKWQDATLRLKVEDDRSQVHFYPVWKRLVTRKLSGEPGER